MTIKELMNLFDLDSDLDIRINSIKTDSRNIEENDVFIAIKGKTYDGNDYIEEAFSRGAILCITEIDYVNSIKVDNIHDAIFKIGKYIRSKYDIPLIGITGSNGKTTTKELLEHILSSKYKVFKNELNHNTLIGVTTELSKLDDSYDIIVMEFGSNKIGEISELSKLCSPDLAIITNIGTSHLKYFKTTENIFKEKYSIIDGMKIPRLIVNGDSKYLNKLKKYKCGTKLNSDLVAYNIKVYDDYLTFNIFIEKEYLVRFNSPCKHFVNDILLAIKASFDYGIDVDTIIDSISTFKMIDRRFEIEKINNITIIKDYYNSSYESVVGGINYLKGKKGKKLLILGDILELGDYSKKIHKKINFRLKFLHNKDIITVGKNSKYIKGTHFNKAEDVLIDLKKYKYIYIKGSRRINLDIVYNYIKSKVIV